MTLVLISRPEHKNLPDYADHDASPPAEAMDLPTAGSGEPLKPHYVHAEKPPSLLQRPLKGFRAPTRTPLSAHNPVSQTPQSTRQGQGNVTPSTHRNILNF